MSILGEIFKVGVLFAEAAASDSQVKKIQQSEEFQEELKNNIAELEKEDDRILLLDFHKEYADSWNGDAGLFLTDSSSRMDPLFMAYMNVFKKRDIKKREVRCNDYECDSLIGYRMVPSNFEIIKYDDNLTHGYCNCNKCGKNLSWEIRPIGYRDEAEISVYEF